MMTRWYLLSLLAAMALAAETETARADFVTLNFPGSINTIAWGIDGSNVVGRYGDATGSHGFVYNGSTYTSFGPSGINGELRGISGNNLVGIFAGSSGEQPFFYNGSTFTPITGPAGATFATVFAVSGNRALGEYGDAQGHVNAFLQNGVTATPVTIPGVTNVNPNGISANTIVGGLSTGQGFIWNGTTLTTLSVPGAASTSANAISGNLVAGSYTNPQAPAPPGAPRMPGATHGFVYDGTTYTTIDIPGASSTMITGISGNTIVGIYTDSTGIQHGFEETLASGLTPPPPPNPVTDPQPPNGTGSGSNPQPPSGSGPSSAPEPSSLVLGACTVLLAGLARRRFRYPGRCRRTAATGSASPRRRPPDRATRGRGQRSGSPACDHATPLPVFRSPRWRQWRTSQSAPLARTHDPGCSGRRRQAARTPRARSAWSKSPRFSPAHHRQGKRAAGSRLSAVRCGRCATPLLAGWQPSSHVETRRR
jgi:hypothetical protein